MRTEQVGDEPAGRSPRRWLLGLVGGLTVLALGAAYLVAVLTAGDDLPSGTTIEGVAVGGLSRVQAAERLQDELAERADAPLQVTAAGQTHSVPPELAGLGLDTTASVDQVTDRSRWSPATLWDRFTGGDELEAVVTVDDERLSSYLESLDEEVATEPVEGAVRLTRKGVRVVEPEPGVALADADARQALKAAYLSGTSVELPTTQVPPQIDADDVARAREEFAEPALSAPVALRLGESRITLSPRQFARALRLAPEDGALVPQLRSGVLAKQLSSLVSQDGAPPVDATVELVNGEPQVIPGKPGVSFDQARVDAAFLDLVTKPEGERELEVAAAVVEPEFTTEEAEALGIKEEVSEFTTYFPYAEYRNINIGRAAEIVDGTLLAPGDTFSLNETVGERTAENGFTEGYVVADGIFKKDLGGGVSQIATTTFNAMFFAGLKDIEHKPHSVYIDRYPEGREATVAWPSLDLKFKNTTPYGVLIKAWVRKSTLDREGAATVAMFSTKHWKITATKGPRTNYTSPGTRYSQEANCEEFSGTSGFSVDVFRFFRDLDSGKVLRKEKFHTDYIAGDNVICGSPPAPEPEPRPDPQPKPKPKPKPGRN